MPQKGCPRPGSQPPWLGCKARISAGVAAKETGKKQIATDFTALQNHRGQACFDSAAHSAQDNLNLFQRLVRHVRRDDSILGKMMGCFSLPSRDQLIHVARLRHVTVAIARLAPWFVQIQFHPLPGGLEETTEQKPRLLLSRINCRFWCAGRSACVNRIIRESVRGFHIFQRFPESRTALSCSVVSPFCGCILQISHDSALRGNLILPILNVM